MTLLERAAARIKRGFDIEGDETLVQELEQAGASVCEHVWNAVPDQPGSATSPCHAECVKCGSVPDADEGEMTEEEALRHELEWRDEKERRVLANHRAYVRWSQGKRKALEDELTRLRAQAGAVPDGFEAAKRAYIKLTNSVEFADNGSAGYCADQDMMDAFDTFFSADPSSPVAADFIAEAAKAIPADTMLIARAEQAEEELRCADERVRELEYLIRDSIGSLRAHAGLSPFSHIGMMIAKVADRMDAALAARKAFVTLTDEGSKAQVIEAAVKCSGCDMPYAPAVGCVFPYCSDQAPARKADGNAPSSGPLEDVHGAVRPSNCRNRLRDEGKPYPKSGCGHCKTGGLTGCPFERKADGKGGE